MSATCMIRAAARTHVGKKREQNQDAFTIGGRAYAAVSDARAAFDEAAVTEGRFIAAIADGIGGHAAGEIASAIAVREIAALAPTTQAAALHAVEHANRELFAAMRADPALRSMGTTVAGITAGPETVEVFGVGDCFIAHIGGRYVRPLLRSYDDVVATTVLDAALGGAPEPGPLSIETASLPGGRGRYFLATDGVLRFTDWDELKALLLEPQLSPVEITDRIVALVLSGRAGDNLTCAIVEVTDV